MKRKNIFYSALWLLAFTFLLSLMLTTVKLEGQDSVSMRKLEAAVALLVLQGYEPRPEAKGKYLTEGDYYTIKTTLYRGNKYKILAAGDDYTRDLDIYLYDENWNEIDKDSQEDALPIVEVTPQWSGTFYIKVKMYEGSGYSNVAICFKEEDKVIDWD
ncbi:MAG: hypothetical protein JSV88_19080 [Candidatus Aminicenantes bacterium]|nr:MAG: hypothetical protein JSV88_19080 [Candidatus Aminicenantes bacterium]